MSSRYDWQILATISLLSNAKRNIMHFSYLDWVFRFDANPSRREIGRDFVVRLLLVLYGSSQSIDSIIRYTFTGHLWVRAYIHRLLCGKSHSLHLNADRSTLSLCCMDLLRLSTLLIGVLLDFDVSHVIDSVLPLNAYGSFCQCSFECNKLTSTVTNKFCTCIEARSCEEY